MIKRYLVSVISVLILFVMGALVINTAPKSYGKSGFGHGGKLQYNSASDESFSSGTNISIAQPSSYMIIIEDSYLRTYRMMGSQKFLLRETEADPLLMSDSDVKKLKNGIYSNSLEDIYLYYESYAS